MGRVGQPDLLVTFASERTIVACFDTQAIFTEALAFSLRRRAVLEH